MKAIEKQNANLIYSLIRQEIRDAYNQEEKEAIEKMLDLSIEEINNNPSELKFANQLIRAERNRIEKNIRKFGSNEKLESELAFLNELI